MGTTRTNIEIDDDAVAEIMRRYGLKSKREAVDMALHHLAGHPMTREEMLEMEGARIFDDVPGEELDRPHS